MPIERLAQVPWQALDVAAALPVIDSVLAGAPADRELERLLRGHREWASPQRTAAAEAVFGVGLWRRRLGWHAGVEAGDLLIQGGPRPRPNAIVSRASDIAGALRASLLRDLAGAPLPRSLPHSPPARAGDPGRLADRWSLPDWLERHLQRELGAPADRFCAAISEPGPITLRATRALSTRAYASPSGRILRGSSAHMSSSGSSLILSKHCRRIRALWRHSSCIGASRTRTSLRHHRSV